MFTGQVWATRHGLSRWLLRAIDRRIAGAATVVLIDSFSQRDFLVQEGVVSTEASQVLGNGSICGVNTTRFSPNPEARLSVRAKLGLATDVSVILFVGRLNIDKGCLDLARAASCLSETMKFVVLFVGPDEQHMQTRIKMFDKNQRNLFRFVDYTVQPERYMAAADVFCLPSYREGFGSVIIEAAACGVPAVASRIYGLTDAVEDKITGLLFEAGNSEDLGRKLLQMLSDPTGSRAMGVAARERATNLFSADRLTGAILELYKRLSVESHA
jgi:glycosyltransferase involved in cell wall biosynthesis